MIFEISNPSDPYTVVGDDFEVVCIAISVLGKGAYGLNQLCKDGTTFDMPPFPFGGCEEWFQDFFGKSYQEAYDDVIDNCTQSLIDVFDSVVIGRNVDDRKVFEIALGTFKTAEEKANFRNKYLEDRRTSMTNIGKNAQICADFYREYLAKHEVAA